MTWKYIKCVRCVDIEMKEEKIIFKPLAGFEPHIFGILVRRVNHYTLTLGTRGFFFFSKEAQRSEKTGEGRSEKKKPLVAAGTNLTSMRFWNETARQTGFLDTSVRGAANRKTSQSQGMTNFASASKTLVKKVVPVHSVNNFCKVCNINLLISGFGKLNMFDGVYSKPKEQCREFAL